ncbi:unnamed protein product [Linum trigynum]
MDAADTEEGEDGDLEEVPEDDVEDTEAAGDDLDQFAAALAYEEEGFQFAAAAVLPGGLSGGLVDYSSDDSSSLGD